MDVIMDMMMPKAIQRPKLLDILEIHSSASLVICYSLEMVGSDLAY